jgi:hypothetical protein
MNKALSLANLVAKQNLQCRLLNASANAYIEASMRRWMCVWMFKYSLDALAQVVSLQTGLGKQPGGPWARPSSQPCWGGQCLEKDKA